MFYPENSRPHPRRIIIHPRNSNIRLTNQETAPSSLQAMPPPPPLPPSPRQVNHWDKFVLLMWKNWLLVRRLKVQTTLEIIIPVIFSALLVLIRGLSDPDVFPEPFDYDSLPLVDSNWNRTREFSWTIAYSPQNPILDKIMEDVQLAMNLTRIEPYASAELLNARLTVETNRPLVGIIFDESFSPSTSQVPKHLNYKMRFPGELRAVPTFQSGSNVLYNNWRTQFLYPPFAEGGPRNRHRDTGGRPPGYYDEKFSSVQSAVSLAFIKLHGGGEEGLPEIKLQRFSYPPATVDILLEVLKVFVALIFFLSFLYPCINNVKMITVEKERQLKESMKIMGLPSWLHWTAWFVKIMIFMVISITIMVGLLKIRFVADSEMAVFTHSNGFALWLFLFIYSLSVTMFIFMMSVMFSRANTAATVAGLVWFLFSSPFNFTEPNYDTMSLTAKMLVCLFHNSGMSYGFLLILSHEANLEGLQWNNIFTPVTVDDNFTVGHVMIMLLVASLLYLLITLYLEKIFPGDFGVPEKWNFPITMLLGTSRRTEVEDAYKSGDGGALKEHIEAYPEGKSAGIQMRGLRKIFGGKKVAVEGLTLNMFDDEITVLLGDNGAGKTTTMSMLTGMFPPTAGTAIVNGCDIRSDIAGVRQSIGLCPQHNILFDDLTVREHIIFFSKLKGLTDQEAEAEVRKFVEILELQPKIEAQSKTLSGGMKRKLSVGVALCGGSRVVLCDEPTSGMDPAARRALWDLLQQEKKGRTIILTTHFMDEADVLGDRIAIMHSGELKCYGSSFFLKNIFGAGYELVCEKGTKCDVNGVTRLLRRYIEDVRVDTDVGSELSYKLDTRNSRFFKAMLKELEEKSTELGVDGYGISLTTLEEVFIKVTSDDSELNSSSPSSNGQLAVKSSPQELEDVERATFVSLSSFETERGTLTGIPLITNQVKAMFLKKSIYTKRNWVLLFVQVMIPVVLTVITVLITKAFVISETLPELPIHMDNYPTNPVALISNHAQNINSPGGKFSAGYSKLFTNPPTPRTLLPVNNVRDFILNLTAPELVAFNNRYLIGVTVEDDLIITWFNNQPYHTVPLSLDVTFNALLQSYCPDCSIQVTNKPLPFTFDTRLTMLRAGNNMGFQLASNIGFAMCFVAAFYIIFYIRERVSKSKLLQFVSGINIWTFWITAFLWDLVTFVFTVVVVLVTVLVFQEEGWRTADDMGRLFMLLLCFVWCVLPFVYLFSMVFDVPSSGFIKTVMVGIFLGLACFYVVFSLESPILELEHVAEKMTWIFLAVPHFALIQGLSNLNVINSILPYCRQACDALGPFCPNVEAVCVFEPRCCDNDYFAWEAPGIGRHITYLIVVGAILFVILFLKELHVFDGLFYRSRKMYSGPPPAETEDAVMDSDVLMEKHRIRGLTRDEIRATSLVTQSMTKFYGNHLAVNQLSLAVQSGECFGLLGVNGAGKTSTFKMLIGDETISSGDAYVAGISLKTDLKEIYKDIGYCPQFDALLDELTGRETLRIFCMMRGIAPHKIEVLSLKLAKEFNFIKHIDKQVKQYSGGNKRKLSTAIALIGSPTVVYLDEPTTGMDPGAKRHLWGVMSRYRSAGKSIVLTSHSMEECEALCTRLAIMVNGEFKCLGSTQHLKNKFSKGYLLIIQMSNRNTEASEESRREVAKVKSFISANLTGAVVKEEHQGRLAYYIPITDTKWSTMFDILETGKNVLAIESYSLSQTSLEQVFLSFTKYQREDTRVIP